MADEVYLDTMEPAVDNSNQQLSHGEVYLDSPETQQPLSPTDKAIQVLGQFGKSIYNNPIAHPGLKALSDLVGTNADQAYGNLPEPQGVMEKVASGLGSAVPIALATSPIMDAVGGVLGAADAAATASGASKAIPVLGKLTGFLKNSDLAKSAITGYAYGKSEALAMQAQGQQVDSNQYAQDTAKQFLMWGALTRGGATLASKLLPKELPGVQQFVANMPNSVKKAFTPEGLGSIAGGALAGSINAPDQQSGIAGAVVGGALSAMNPSEKFQFKVGMGKAMGMNGISGITDHWGMQFKLANDVIKNDGFDKVEQVGSAVDPTTGENAIHMAAKTQIDNYDKTWQDLHNQTQPILQDMDQKALSGLDTLNLVNGIRNLINNKFRTPGYLSKTKSAFESAYPSLQAIELPTALAKQYGIAPEDFNGKTFRTSISDIQKITDPQIQQKLMTQIGKDQILRGGINNVGKNGMGGRITDVSFQALDDLRQTMNKIGQSNDPYESGTASKIAQMLSDHMKAKSDAGNPGQGPYTRLMADWKGLFSTGEKMGETQDYQKLAQKLSNPHWSQNSTVRINTENNLKSIDKYFVSKGKSPVKGMIDQYHAYNVYANPTVEGFNKNAPARIAATTAASLVGTTLGLGPISGAMGAYAGWKMSSPEAWIPVLKGASK